MSSIDSTGLTIDSLSEIIADYETEIKAALGENTKVDPQSVFGQIINIMAIAMADQQQLIQGVADNFNPNNASGKQLADLVQINGIEKQESEYSTGSVNCTSTANGVTIPAGSLISDPVSGVQVATDIDLVLGPSDTKPVSVTAVEPGAVAAAAGTLTKIDTPKFGWLSVTNPSALVEGLDEETDPELKVRRTEVAERSGSSSVSAIYGAVSDVTGVSQLDVLVNNGTAVDTNGVPPQHIWVIVEGGSDADVAAAIFSRAGGGIGLVGTTTVSHYDSQTNKNYDVKFSRPSDINIYITVNLTVDSDYPVDGDTQVENALLAYFTSSQTLGEDVVTSRLYTPINSVDGHTIDSVYIGISASPTLSTNISIDVDEIAVTDSAKIVVNS